MLNYFDILYRPAHWGVPETHIVMARRVGAIDPVFAMLWYVRNELGFTVDPIELAVPYEYKLGCGCEIFIEFQYSVKTAVIETTPCEKHQEKAIGDHPSSHRRWNGDLFVERHDADRPDMVKIHPR